MRHLIPVFCLLFGAMTLKEGGTVLFVDGADRQAAGNYVPWVLWFNFLTGFAFIAAGLGMWRKKKWVTRLTPLMAAMSVVVLISFLLWVATGGSHETRTLVAMPLRTVIWLGLAFWSVRFKGRIVR
ncbi:MAG: hypothetical protein IT285_13770 [Bdellovibrionales bacterium]|nr:hypothetical protein [Bdellovibrionales bacterium]